MKNHKTIKVGFRNIPYSEHYVTKYKSVPQISLSGKWLEKCGFNISDKVDVFIGEEIIVIKREKSSLD